MNIAKLIDRLRYGNLDDKVYIQTPFNRYPVANVEIKGDHVLIHLGEHADNPPRNPYEPPKRIA